MRQAVRIFLGVVFLIAPAARGELNEFKAAAEHYTAAWNSAAVGAIVAATHDRAVAFLRDTAFPIDYEQGGNDAFRGALQNYFTKRYCQMLWMGEVRRRFPEPSIHP